MSAPTRDEVIRMAREAGTPDPMVFLAAYERLVAAAYARGVASESNRADALAATIAELRDLVTTEGETKADFVACVRAVLGEDPDARVVRAVAAEREACALLADDLPAPEACNTIERHLWDVATVAVGDAIRERGKP